MLTPISLIFSGYDTELTRLFPAKRNQGTIQTICSVLELIISWDLNGNNMQQLYRKKSWTWSEKVFDPIKNIIDQQESLSLEEFENLQTKLQRLQAKFEQAYNHCNRMPFKLKHNSGITFCKKLSKKLLKKSSIHDIARLWQEQERLEEEEKALIDEVKELTDSLTPEHLEQV